MFCFEFVFGAYGCCVVLLKLDKNTGSVSIVSHGFTIGGVFFTDQIRTSNVCNAGDSDGPIFHAINLPGKTNVNVLIALGMFRTRKRSITIF
jgi:hypothetical protein